MKFGADQEMLPDWFSDRDNKVPHVILNDKLMSDAILGGMPIKTEHSYSLNSDGDSMAYSPQSLQKQIEDGKLTMTAHPACLPASLPAGLILTQMGCVQGDHPDLLLYSSHPIGIPQRCVLR